RQFRPVTDDPDSWQAAKDIFHRETKILEIICQHDQVAKILDCLEIDHSFYIVQDFIPGRPLSEELNQPWSESRVINLLQEVLEILAFVHGQGVIHGDIKPDNLIRRSDDSKLVLTDFSGIKQVRTPLVGVQFSAIAALGAFGYIPTEQILGKPRPCSDLYAVGMIAIEALTGLKPIHLEEDPLTGEALWQDYATVTKDFAGIIQQMVRYYFKDRYQSADQVLEALHSLTSSKSSINLSMSSAPPTSPNPYKQKTEDTLGEPIEPETLPTEETEETTEDTLGEPIEPETLPTEETEETEEIYYPSMPTIPTRKSSGLNLTAMGVSTSVALLVVAGGYLFSWGGNQAEAKLAQAEQKYQEGDLDAALKLVKSIPADSENYQDAQNAIAQWKKDWQDAKALFPQIKTAFEQQKWVEVIEQASQIPNIVFWQQQIEPMVSQSQANLEKEAYQLLQQAYNQAIDRDFTGALNTFKQIPKGTKAYATIQQKIPEYTQKRNIKANFLLQQAYNRAAQKDFTNALVYLKKIPQNTDAYPKAQEKIVDYTAKQEIRAKYLSKMAYNQAVLKNYTKALDYLKQIPKGTSVYASAQATIQQYAR
ncbi:serine/threonine-protein kinase, partial [Moorena sp. SIO4A5]|uniref:protein kinase domain-containing protein n=1 Tax=Moorena sp. SIO4A5 TaxID=2607838 RepID=UPI0013CC7743